MPVLPHRFVKKLQKDVWPTDFYYSKGNQNSSSSGLRTFNHTSSYYLKLTSVKKIKYTHMWSGYNTDTSTFVKRREMGRSSNRKIYNLYESTTIAQLLIGVTATEKIISFLNPKQQHGSLCIWTITMSFDPDWGSETGSVCCFSNKNLSRTLWNRS